MANTLDNAITRILNIAAALTTLPPTGTTVKAFQDYPVETTQPFPFAIAYLGGGHFRATNATIHHNFPTVNVEFHFSRTNLGQAYQQINAVVLEFPKRIAADPTLDSTVTTVVMTPEEDVQYVARPFEYGGLKSQMLMFTVPVKTLQAPQSTST